MNDSFGVKNSLLVPMDGREPFRGTIVVFGGRISFCGYSENAPSVSNIEDGSGYIVIPGLINAHLHGDAYIFKGLLDNLSLKEQYMKTNMLNDLMDDEIMLLSRTLSYIEAVRSGATYIIEHSFKSLGERSIEPFISVGIKGAIVFDRDDITDELVKFVNSHGLDIFVNLPSEEDFSIEMLRELAEFSRKSGIRLYGHIAETTWRLALCYERFSKSPIEVLDMTRILETHPIIVHGCFLSESDIYLLKKYEVNVVNTPVSEMKISDGIAPIPMLIKYGVNVGLGTDGALWNNSADILCEAKTLILLHSLSSRPGIIDEETALGSITSMGRRVLGRDNIGVLQENASADFILVRATDIEMLPLDYSKSKSKIISNIILSAGKPSIDRVYISGIEIVRDGDVVNVDTMTLINRVNGWLDEKNEEIEEIIYNNI
ncbi:MAG: amidohydrolase family protein [bacterium]